MGNLQLSGAEALHLWVTVALLFAAAKLFGGLARRIGQPAVVGALTAGVLVGPSGLGAIWPRVNGFVLPGAGGAQLLGAILGLCLLLLLIVLGAETDLALLRRVGRPVITVSAGSILIPLMGGSLVAFGFAGALFPQHPRMGAILLGGGLGISSLPIIAQLVTELGLSRRNFGQLAVAVAVVNDVYGFILLVVTESVVQSHGGVTSMLVPIGGLILVSVVLVVFGQRAVDFLLRHTRTDGPNPTAAVAVAIAVALAAAAAMQVFGIDAALGAFFAGVIVGRSRFQHSSALHQLRSLNESIFAPLYFAGAGLQVDVWLINSRQRLAALGALLVAAVAVKALGAWLGARAVRLEHKESVALAILLNGRGTMQVIVGGAALRLGLFSHNGYTIVLVVAIGSSAVVSPAIRRLVGNWLGSCAERERLAHEQRLRRNVVVRGQRLLLPLSEGSSTAFVAGILDRAWPGEAELSVLHARNRAVVPTVQRTLRWRRTSTDDSVNAVLAEAKLGYGLIGIGLPTRPDSGVGAFAEELLERTPVPVVLTRPGRSFGHRSDVGPWQSVAVGTKGTTACRAAEEIAAGLCRHDNACLHLVHVAPPVSATSPDRRSAAEIILDEACVRAREVGPMPQVVSVEGHVPLDDLSAVMRNGNIDLLVIGARVRRTGSGIFLGHTVEGLLRAETPFAVVVVAFPDTAPDERDQPYAACEPAIPRPPTHPDLGCGAANSVGEPCRL